MENKIACKCEKCARNPDKVGFTGTKWEEHFGGRSQRPFRHIFFKTIDVSLKVCLCMSASITHNERN